MLIHALLPDESQLCINRIEIEEKEETIVLSVSSTSPTSICPHCGTTSDRVHSCYQRQPADLPFASYSVRLNMNVRRFFCDNPICQLTTFAERIPSVLAPYARRTNRLASVQQQVALVLGGEAGSRLLAIMKMLVSPDTLIRMIRNAPEPEIKIPRVLGVDDWAKRKRHSYGTILIDLENHQPVDLLPDRSATSLAEWLKSRSGIEIISRDRGDEYIKGINEGAPDAIQVADRWHLLKNLQESLEEWLETKRDCLQVAAERSAEKFKENSKAEESEQGEGGRLSESEASEAPSADSLDSLDSILKAPTPKNNGRKLAKAEEQKLAIRARRLERYEAVKEMHAHGFSKSAIARYLKIDRRTVSKYVQAKTCPMYPERRILPSKLDPYKEYIIKRWQEGCRKATPILHEIRQLGFDGSRSFMMKWVSENLKPFYPPPSKPSTKKTEKVIPIKVMEMVKMAASPWTARRASWLFVKQQTELSEDDQKALERMKQADEKVAEAYSLGQLFVKMIREREPQALMPWLEDVFRSGIDTLRRFAKGIKEDLEAVTNALSLPWSQGQVEGQVNRLKLIKRQMYGRANFDLLRKRVLSNSIIGFT